MSDMHNTREGVGGGRALASVLRTLSRSSSRSSLPGSGKKKLPSLLQALRRTRKMRSMEITLPSDKQWRLKNYFKLLERQRQRKLNPELMLSEDPSDDGSLSWDPALLQPEAKRAKLSGSTSASSEASIPTSQSLDIVWTALDIAKAGLLLGHDPDQVTFHDEDEMRRVFTLLYDVFRYKVILNEALTETGFNGRYPQYKDKASLVWLLFYDLHKRRFLPREHADVAICRDGFRRTGLLEIEQHLWNSRVKLAASLARHRIKNNALKLNQLLPYHLRDDKLVSIDETPVTGWINTYQNSKKNICEKIESTGLKLQDRNETILTTSDFRFDHLCPKLLLCHPAQRAELAQSQLVKSHTIVLQDRAFCLGPSMMAKVLLDTCLRGIVALTHVNSPRTTAYLANILQDNPRVDRVIAFGAADRIGEYHNYLRELGVDNCDVYPQRFVELHPEAPMLENLMAVLATPPNSYTGVTDPVDLICSRGGDMTMLRALTQTEMNDDALGYLAEQRETLKYSMSLPQVQIIMYETHSVAHAENLGMASKSIEEMNNWAKEKHTEEQRIIHEHEEAEEKLNKPMTPCTAAVREQREREALEAQEAALLPRNVDIPPCDLFELAELPELCSHGGACLEDEGCYVARIQRKEIISLDAKYMIKIAEARGLFGGEGGPKKSSTARAQKKREETVANRPNAGSAKTRGYRRGVKVEMDRITAPTQASIHRNRRDSVSSGCDSCPRHLNHAAESLQKVTEARRQLVRGWWREAYRLVLRLAPYEDMTPRTRAAVGVPVLALPRGTRRRPFPVHRAMIEFEACSDSGVLDQILDTLTEIRRNSC